VAIVAKDGGSIAASYAYDPYGVAVSVSETGLNQANVVRFAGGIHDETVGLAKFGKRFYDPNLGRFTQQDILNVIATRQATARSYRCATTTIRRLSTVSGARRSSSPSTRLKPASMSQSRNSGTRTDGRRTRCARPRRRERPSVWWTSRGQILRSG